MTENFDYRGSTIYEANGADAFVQLIDTVQNEGRPREPRGLATLDLLDVTVVITNPCDVLLDGTRRHRYTPSIGAIEGLLLLAGVSDPNLLKQVAPVFQRFQDGGALHGAYGPRLGNQMPRVVQKLLADRDTRQAVATIWDPAYDLTTLTNVPNDVPCTVYLGFRVVNDALDLKVHMRSNDLWRGFPYDVIQFTLLQLTVARLLELEVGVYTHHADSLHLYETDLEVARMVAPRPRMVHTCLDGLSVDGTANWADVRKRAMHLLYDETYVPASATESWLCALLPNRNEELSP